MHINQFFQHLGSYTTQGNSAVLKTTNFPANPYVFSAEDYNVLQNTENVEDPFSLITYEPQKINSKESKKTFFMSDSIMGKISISLRILNRTIKLNHAFIFYFHC